MPMSAQKNFNAAANKISVKAAAASVSKKVKTTTSSVTTQAPTVTVTGASAAVGALYYNQQSGQVLMNNGTGSQIWTSPNTITYPNNPTWITNTTTTIPGSLSITGWPTNIISWSLLEANALNITLNEYKSFLAGELVTLPATMPMDYPLESQFYSIYIEQDYSDDISLSAMSARDVNKKQKRMSLFVLDRLLNRLEFCAIAPEADPKANLESLIDISFNVVKDKTEYISGLYCRFLPILHYNLTNIVHKTSGSNVSATVDFERALSAGITPIMHLSNVVFGGLLPPTKKDISAVFDNLTTEVLVLHKERFPKIQRYFSPEYGYLSLDETKDLKSIARSHNDYSLGGLQDLLRHLCVPGTVPGPFALALTEHIGLDQRIKDTADCAVSRIKSFIDSAY